MLSNFFSMKSESRAVYIRQAIKQQYFAIIAQMTKLFARTVFQIGDILVKGSLKFAFSE